MSSPARLSRVVAAHDPHVACDFIAQYAELSKSRVKDAMNKGAVWLTRAGRGRQRLRRATAELKNGDRVELFYDEQILSRIPPPCPLLLDREQYSAWNKPAGMLAQGTEFGDHNSVLRIVGQYFKPPRPVFLVHRLDREASGAMLVAHSSDAAARLSKLFQGNEIEKRYAVIVRGRLEPESGTIDAPLDGKPARTEYRVARYDAEHDCTHVDVRIATGRLHQIRRHFDAIGHPVLGDPRYGTGNKNEAGLQLVAAGLRFRCPFRGDTVEVLSEREGATEPDARLT
jgi:tRNA pseudouridine32 synthase/23S rRNA pseudouridine746 synthase